MTAQDYKGVVIEESLKDVSILKKLEIIDTKISVVTEKHKTSWLKQWTLHAIEVSEDQADDTAEKLSKTLDTGHTWYADFKNNDLQYVIFLNKVFKVDRSKKEDYKIVVKYGVGLGIPEYQLPHFKE